MYLYIIGCVLVLVAVFYLLKIYMQGGKCYSKARLDGKIILITGGNTGIGKETAIDLAQRGGVVIIACRDEKKGTKAVTEIREVSKSPNIFLKILDLASLESILNFTELFIKEYTHLDILINNAGVMMCPHLKTKDGFELQFGTNHLGHFALTNLLLPLLKKSNSSRIVNVASLGHMLVGGMRFNDLMFEKGYNSIKAYNQSKLANILFTKELNRKVKQFSISTFALHPGVVATELARHSIIMSFIFYFGKHFGYKTPIQGAQTSIYCAVEEGLEEKSGMYFADCAIRSSSRASLDEGAAKKLWEISEQLTGISYPF